jgi:photosystem II stability/assembly factor-like uncharacterized protein
MKNWQKILIPVLALTLVGLGISGLNETKGLSENDKEVAGLHRHQSVIQAKIDRKEAKLAGTYEKPQNPQGIADERRKMRSHPEGSNVTQLLLEAMEQTKAMRSIDPQKDAGLWDWSWDGPGNIGGRIRAILLHPDDEDIMWLGTASGGIWRTNNAGSYWYPITDFLPSLSITALEMDPNDPNVIFASTGEGIAGGPPGAGIFKSTDGGETWNQQPDSVNPTSYKWINDLIIHPTNGDILLAATETSDHEGWIIRSEDGGEHWGTVFGATTAFTDLAMDPDSPAVVLASTQESVYRSDNSGLVNSWVELSTGLPDELPDDTGRTAFAFGVGNDMVYASADVPNGDNYRGQIWRSSDNGLTWEHRSSPLHMRKQGWYDNVIWLEPGSTDRIIFGGIDLYKSLNGGLWNTVISDWNNYHEGGLSAHADQHVIIPHINYGNGNSTVFVGNDGGIQKRESPLYFDTTGDWVNLANNLGITQFYSADANLDGSLILGGTQDNDDLLFTRSDGSQDWFQANAGDGTYTAINPVQNNIMFTSYVHLAMTWSFDFGQTYYHITDGLWDAEIESKSLFIAPFALDRINTTYLVAGGTSIWRTSNSGDYWHQVLEPLSGDPKCSAVEISPHVGAIVNWVGYEDGSIRKTENWYNWTAVTGPAPGPDHTFITDIEISPHDSETVIVVFGGYAADRIWITRDNGQSWNPLPGQGDGVLPMIHTNCVTFHPNNPNWLYVGTDIGIFASEDLGQHWSVTQRYELSEGPAYVEVSDLVWHSGDTLVAATYGRGIYECRPLEYIYVDIANSGEEDGSWSDPYNTFDEGYLAAGNGSNLIMTGGDYQQGNRFLFKRMTVTGQNGSVVIR